MTPLAGQALAARSEKEQSVLKFMPEAVEIPLTVSSIFVGFSERHSRLMPSDITQLLNQIRDGEANEDQLYPLIYEELRHAAANLMRRQRRSHTLQATAVANEAYLRIAQTGFVKRAESRRHLIGTLLRCMRQVLYDHYEKRRSQKRGGDRARVPYDAVIQSVSDRSQCQFDELHAALDQLELDYPEHYEVVLLRLFYAPQPDLANDQVKCGLTVPEVAELLEVSVSTVERRWAFARARLFGMLNGETGE